MKTLCLASLWLLTLLAPPAGPTRVWTDVEIVGQRSVERAAILEHVPLPIGEPYADDRETWAAWGRDLEDRFGFHDVGVGAVRFTDGRCYLVVNVVEKGDEDLLLFRDAPTGSAALPEGVVELHDAMQQRARSLFRQGTPSRERSENGFLDYDDEELHGIALQLVEATAGHREQLVTVVKEDADANRRGTAARLLNWAGDVEASIMDVHTLVDDPDVVVRNNLTRFMLHYVDRIESVEARHAIIDTMADQLRRPSHADRNKALSALRRILVKHPDEAAYIDAKAGPAIETVADQSVLGNVGGVARAIRLQIAIEQKFMKHRRDAFPSVADISAEALRGRADDADMLIVDCRTDAERAVSTIPDAISIADFETSLDRYRERTIVTYCTIGYRSGVYGKKLSEDSIDVLNLRGGVLGWARAGGSFVDPEGRETKRVHVFGDRWNLLPDGYESVTDSP